MYTITEVFNNTTPADRKNDKLERNIEALLEKSQLTMEENKSFMK